MLVTRSPEEADRLAEPSAAFVPFPGPVTPGIFLAREKRFLVRARLEGREIWLHSNNTGSMLGLTRPGMPLLASRSDNPRRRLAHTQEAVRLGDGERGFWVGVDTSVPGRMLRAAFLAGALPFLRGYETLRTEVRRGESRVDALARGRGLPDLWTECKNVTLVEDGIALFPDAPSERAARHLRELMDIVRSGARAVMFYLVQRPDGRCFGPAWAVDGRYAELFHEAVRAGVGVEAWEGEVSPSGVRLKGRLPLADEGL